MIRKEKGITLLALIITVVIMIILAAVTINVTLGDGGLVQQAQHAAEQTANATKSEQEQLEDAASKVNEIIAGIGSGGDITNSTGGEDTNQVGETNSVDTNSVDTNSVDTNSVEETNTIDTNTIEPEPEPIPDGTITIGEPQWQGDGTANVSVTSSEGGYIIQYQINGTKDGSWLTVQGGIVTGVKHGDTVYARLTDGEQYSDIQNKKIEDTIPPQVTVTAQGSPSTNSIVVTVQTEDVQSGMADELTYTYYIKQSTEPDSNYNTPDGASNITNNTYNFTGLTQGTSYDIKVEVNGDKAGNKGIGTLANQTTQTVPGADEGLETGAITASPVTWENEKAKVTLTSNATDSKMQIEYQINTTNEEDWKASASPVTVSNLNHGDTVYARLTDGSNVGASASINILDTEKPVVSNISVDEVTSDSIKVTVTASDSESGLADTGTYRYYLNNEESPRVTSESNTYTFTGLTASTDYTIKVEAVDRGDNVGTGTTSATTEEMSVSETDTQVANYADVDGNGTVDGIIYADLAIGGSGGYWPASNGSYTIPKGSNFKKYKITQESYTGSFGEGKVISPINGSGGNERFYVMALNDVDSSTHQFWSASGTSVVTSTDFGTGESNTVEMKEKGSTGMWGISLVQSGIWNDSGGWYVPSRDEWSAFAGELNITTSNYSDYGLSYSYWSSSQNDTRSAWYARFNYVNFDNEIYDVYYRSYVRLGTTF